MTTVRTTCPACGQVDLQPEDIYLFEEPDLQIKYSFTCPVCEVVRAKRTDPKVLALLMSVGIEIHRSAVHNETPPANPITKEELLDFHEFIETWNGNLDAEGNTE